MAQTYDKNGVQYIFAHSNCGTQWDIPPHRFQITGLDIQLAQFITSNWYANVVKPNNVRYYLIIGIRGSFKYTDIKNAINNSTGNDLTQGELCLNIVFKEKYLLNSNMIQDYITDFKNEGGSFNMCIGSMVTNTALIFRGRVINGAIYVTLPEFSIYAKK